MFPSLKEGDLVTYKSINSPNSFLKKGSIVITRNPFNQNDLIIKRIKHINDLEVDLVGDNVSESIDSRHFGVIHIDQLIGLVDQIIPKIY
tara:strand:- start:125 stop:394 length:270 start_codon:yes stop_codon:yes gene_type:complete